MRVSLVVLTAVLVAFPTGRARAQTAGAPIQDASQSVGAFLRQQLAEPNTDPDTTTRFIATALPVRGQKPDYVVYVSGQTWAWDAVPSGSSARCCRRSMSPATRQAA